MATVVNYACHPTTLAWDNTLVSPDYVGALAGTGRISNRRPLFVSARGLGGLGPVLWLRWRCGSGRPQRPRARLCDNGRAGAIARAWRAVSVLGTGGIGCHNRNLGLPGTFCRGAGAKSIWNCQTFAVPLPYRPDLPTREQTQVELTRWQQQEQVCLAAENAEGARAAPCPDRTDDAAANAAGSPAPRSNRTAVRHDLATGRRLVGLRSGRALQSIAAALRKQFPAH